jgi:hypothetical protein
VGTERSPSAAQQWLPDALAPASENAVRRSGTGPRGQAGVPNCAGPERPSEVNELKELAELQRTEISVLVRRIQELESELGAAKK